MATTTSIVDTGMTMGKWRELTKDLPDGAPLWLLNVDSAANEMVELTMVEAGPYTHPLTGERGVAINIDVHDEWDADEGFEDDPLDEFNDTIESGMEKRVGDECDRLGLPSVDFSVRKYDEDGRLKNILDEVAVEGPVILLSDDGGPRRAPSYFSEIVHSPTWLEVAVHAARAIKKTGDDEHCFLEELKPTSPKDYGHPDAAVYTMHMGS